MKLSIGFLSISIMISTTLVGITFSVKRMLYGVDLLNWVFIEIGTAILFYIAFRFFCKKKFLGTYVHRSFTKIEKQITNAGKKQYRKLLKREQFLRDFSQRYLVEGKTFLSD